MNPQKKQTLLLMGNDVELSYLLGRFAEQIKYQLTIAPEKISMQDVAITNPAAIIFSSMDRLDKAQTLITELAHLEVPIIVCSSVSDQVRARKLGADSCMLHPITFDGFQSALSIASMPKQT